MNSSISTETGQNMSKLGFWSVENNRIIFSESVKINSIELDTTMKKLIGIVEK